MTEAPTPLTPADCDLRDFDRMPLDLKRLGGSKFDAMLDDTAWRAGVNLWGAAWHGSPAGSLDDDDEALCVAAGLRDLKKWAKVRKKAMGDGWVKCSDGRFYHKTVSEIALEAWLDKLAQRLSSGAGNEKRWGKSFDRSQVEADIEVAVQHLELLNADSKAIAKARRKLGKPKSGGNPGGTQEGPGEKSRRESQRDEIPRGKTSQENGMEQNGREDNLPPPEPEARARGVGPAALTAREWFARIDALADELKLNRTTTGIANIAPLRALCEPTDPDQKPCDWDLDVEPAIRATAATCALRSWTHPAITDTARANRDRRLNPPEPKNGPQHRTHAANSGRQPGGMAGAALRLAARDAERETAGRDDDDRDRDGREARYLPRPAATH